MYVEDALPLKLTIWPIKPATLVIHSKCTPPYFINVFVNLDITKLEQGVEDAWLDMNTIRILSLAILFAGWIRFSEMDSVSAEKVFMR